MAPTRNERDPDWTDTEREGIPTVDTQPPGIDAETAQEGMVLPTDHPLAAEEIGVTAYQQEIPETLAERVRRERPDTPVSPPSDPAGRLTDSEADDEPTAAWADDAAGVPAEEAAVHVREP